MTAGKRILVIDDDVDFREGLVDMLAVLGHNISTAASAEEGLRMIGNSDFDFVFVDAGLPGMNGIDCIGALRASRPDLRCALLTGYGAEWLDMANASATGAPILTKPVTLETVKAMLSQ